MPLDVVFLGTPEPAVDVLDAIMQSPHRVVAVLTAPDRPRGRGMKLGPSPVKSRAEGLPVLQPQTLKSTEVQEEIAALGADVFVIAAYGLIIPQAVIDIPKFGCLNLHFSLLPRLRGAAPVQWALIEGLDKTGVTIMQIDAGLDSGPILAQAEIPIAESDNAGTLEKKMTERGAALMIEVLDRLEAGEIEATPQDETLATYASKISPEDARIDWTMPAAAIRNRIRGFNPRPGAWALLGERRLKILEADVTSDVSSAEPGTMRREGDALLVATRSTALSLATVQPEGRRAMSIDEFLRGYRAEPGERLS